MPSNFMKSKWATALGVLLNLIKNIIGQQFLTCPRFWGDYSKNALCALSLISTFSLDKVKMDNSCCPAFDFDKAQINNSSWCALHFDKAKIDNCSWRALDFHEAKIDNSSWRALDFDKEDYVDSSLVVSSKYGPWSGLTMACCQMLMYR